MRNESKLSVVHLIRDNKVEIQEKLSLGDWNYDLLEPIQAGACELENKSVVSHPVDMSSRKREINVSPESKHETFKFMTNWGASISIGFSIMKLSISEQKSVLSNYIEETTWGPLSNFKSNAGSSSLTDPIYYYIVYPEALQIYCQSTHYKLRGGSGSGARRREWTSTELQ